MKKVHSFHIPVMGIGYTIDTPLKVAHYGIDSVISLVDDILLEKLRKVYCQKFQFPYEEISEKIDDYRAKRITSYLNLIKELAEKKFEELKNSAAEKSHELKEYFNMLPDNTRLKEEFKNLADNYLNVDELRRWVKENLKMGSIDVNIMTKLDKANFINGEKQPVEFNDAHAALRGFAQSDLSSSLVLSAGMNPRLYSYLEKFEDFYPDINGEIKKKIILKVSDFRSAMIQGKFLSKKGLWISEFRIESGLNCGGHAFATDGYLLGPILAEFRDRREELINAMHENLISVFKQQNRDVPAKPLPLKITAQGGVGTAEEHQFLLEHYELDSIGWGSPFLLVPEVVSIDESTLEKLAEAKEEDLYLSNTSPLGVPFNSLRGNSKDEEKKSLIDKARPGSSCPKKFLALNNEYDDKGICTASRQFQYLKINELNNEVNTGEEYQDKFDKIVDKSCICVGLGTSALLVNELSTKSEGVGVSVCPGPNMAYFSKVMSLKEITSHIYGRLNLMTRKDRPHVFIKELGLYVEHLKKKHEEAKEAFSANQKKYLLSFANNLKEGINYYDTLMNGINDSFQDKKSAFLKELNNFRNTIHFLTAEIEKL